ncbi:cell division protein FtsH [Chloroflexota bacterium]
MFATQQFTGQQMRPQQYQYGTVGGIYPQQTDQMGSMFSSMMPMIMMVMMMAILMPMMKGVTGSSKS